MPQAVDEVKYKKWQKSGKPGWGWSGGQWTFDGRPMPSAPTTTRGVAYDPMKDPVLQAAGVFPGTEPLRLLRWPKQWGAMPESPWTRPTGVAPTGQQWFTSPEVEGWAFTEDFSMFLSPEGEQISLVEAQTRLVDMGFKALVYDYSRNLFVPSTEEAVGKREKFYRAAGAQLRAIGEPGFIAPPGTPGAISIEEYQQRIGDIGTMVSEQRQVLTDAFAAVFPGQTIDDLFTLVNDMVIDADAMSFDEVASATELQTEFLETIREVGRTPETEFLLDVMFPDASPEEISELFGIPRTTPTEDVFEAPVILEPEWMNVRTQEVITASEKAKRYPKGYEAELDEWVLTPETGRNYIQVFKVFGESLTKLPKLWGAAILQAIQGHQGASVANKDWADQWIEDAQKDLDLFAREVVAEYGDMRLPISVVDLATLPQSMAFSLTAMGAGLAVGIPTALVPVPGARVAAWTLGTAASGVVAFNMASYQIMQLYLETRNDEMMSIRGSGITAEEEEQLKQEFSSLAIKYGLWEAVPEALSNLAFAKLLTMPLVKMVGRSVASKIIAKVSAIYGEELLTETITQKGQSGIEVEAGLREGRITWVEAFKEIAPQTFLLTTILGGLGQIGISSVSRIKKSLKKEIGEQPLFEVINENITENVFAEVEAESVALEAVPEVTPEVKPPVVPEGIPAPTVPRIELRPMEAKPGEGFEIVVNDNVVGELDFRSTESLGVVGNMLVDIEVFPEMKRKGIATQALDEVMIRSEKQKRPLYSGLLKPEGEAWLKGLEERGVIKLEKQDQKLLGYLISRPEVPITPKPIVKPPVTPEVKPPVAEPGMPEAGLQPSMIEEVPAVEVRPVPKAKVVQAQLDDYLKLKEYEKTQVSNRVKDIEKLLSVKGRLPTGMGTRAELSLELARLEAQKEIASVKTVEHLNTAIEGIETELGNRSMPYHGGAPARYPEWTSQQLYEMLKVYNEARNQLLPKDALKPLLPQEITAKEIETNLAITGEPTLTPTQVAKTLNLFGKYIAAPTTESAWELTRELRRETLAGRAENLKIRTQQLIVENGMSAEDAIRQATGETMSGVLPVADTDYLSDLTQDMREALFSKVYHVLKDEPFEMMSTTEALTNALLGRAIPREPGIRGGSAYSRLMRVFGDQPQVMKAIDTVAEEGKPLEDVIDGVFREVVEGGRPPIPVDQKTADYLRNLSTAPLGQAWLSQDVPTLLKLTETQTPEQIRGETEQLKIELALEPIPVTRYEAPIEDAAKQMPMFPRPALDNMVRVLKEIGWSPIDIGNFLRANKASFDFSFWRQQGPMIINHPIAFVQANIESWKATWSQKAAEASYERITRDPLYHLYDQIGIDFLRPLELKPGTSQWMGVEEFGYLTGERTIPRLTQKIPWVKFSARGFVTGTNEHNWRIFKNHYEAMLRLQEKIASGEIKLKPGEAFSIEKEMTDFAKMLTDFTQRAQLGKLKGLAPALNSMIFAPRATLGRFLTPRHLVSSNPRIRMEAFRNLATFVTGIGGIVLLGAQLGLWDVEKDPKNAEYMSIRIGNIRFDPWAGYRQFLVFYTRIVTGAGISSVTGAEYPSDPIRAMTNFVRGKASPLASILLDFWTGRNFIGEEVDVANVRQWVERIAPFSIWDIYEAYILEPAKAAWIVIPAILGAGIQTYTGEWIENFLKLGLLKYTENLSYGITEPVYDVKDFWADTSPRFKGVDPAILTEDKGFPPYIRAIAEARIINEHLQTLPNQSLVSLNADPAKGATFADYYQMWRGREKIVASGDEEALKVFDADERTRNAQIGNFSQRQFALLNEYWTITDEDQQAEFLLKHKDEIGVNLRKQWLKSHPKENAQLAIWGQTDVFTQAAYDEAQRLIKEFDIPDNAIEKYLPPEDVAKTHFAYLGTGEEFGWNSWETQLLLANDDVYREWRGLDAIETPVRALELKIKGRELSDLYEAYSDKDSPDYILDDDARDEARDKLETDNPEWVEDKRRIEAIENDASDDIVESWVERGKTTDEFGASSSEAKVWLLDNPEVHKWALREGLVTDDGLEWNESLLRLNIEMSKLDKESEEYKRLGYKQDAYQIDIPDNLIDTYIDWYTTPRSGFDDDWFLMENQEFYQTMVDKGIWQERDFSKVPTREQVKLMDGFYELPDAGYDREWYLRENKEFYQDVWLGILGNQKIDFDRIPTREVFDLYQVYQSLPVGGARMGYRIENPDLDTWLVLTKGYKPATGALTGEQKEKLTRDEEIAEKLADLKKGGQELPVFRG